jgi:hypothetical protein
VSDDATDSETSLKNEAVPEYFSKRVAATSRWTMTEQKRDTYIFKDDDDNGRTNHTTRVESTSR